MDFKAHMTHTTWWENWYDEWGAHWLIRWAPKINRAPCLHSSTSQCWWLTDSSPWMFSCSTSLPFWGVTMMYEVIYEHNKLILCQHGATEASLCDFIPRKAQCSSPFVTAGIKQVYDSLCLSFGLKPCTARARLEILQLCAWQRKGRWVMKAKKDVWVFGEANIHQVMLRLHENVPVSTWSISLHTNRSIGGIGPAGETFI